MGYTHGIPWNDDLIKENIIIVVEKLKIPEGCDLIGHTM